MEKTIVKDGDDVGIVALIGSALLFVIFAFVVLLALVNISSRLAMLILFLTPFISTLIIPKTFIAFLSYQHILLANGLVPVNNFHVLMMLWSTLLGIILYTEFLTWYLAKDKDSSKNIKIEISTIQNVLNTVITGVKGKLTK